MVRPDGTASGATRVELGAICEITAGPSGSLLKNIQDAGTGVPMVSPGDLTDLRTIDHSHLRRVPEADAEKLARFSLQENDIVMVRQGSLGGLAMVTSREVDWLYSSSCLRIRPRKAAVDSEYLSAYLAHSRSWTEYLERAVSTTVPLLTSAMLVKFPVAVPDLARQRLITETLQDIDRQLAVERAIIARLESLRPAILEEALQEVGT